MSTAQNDFANNPSLLLLPVELMESLNQTYFLHRLVTEPDKVIPPGKSLLSMMTHTGFELQDDASAQSDEKQPALTERVAEVAHKAFWGEAAEVLSSPLPSVQLPRLRRLYLDMHEALEPLFPPNSRILVSLTSPPPPTSSPLHSTLHLLTEVLSALRQRCAPLRDEKIDQLLYTISIPPPPDSHIPPSHTESSSLPQDIMTTRLAEFVIENMRAILSLADDMKADLNNFVLGSMSESQLVGVLSSKVKSRERDLVLKLWGGENTVRNLWRKWLSEATRGDPTSPASHIWTSRLLQALETNKAVYCSPPPSTSVISNGDGNTILQEQLNHLPPQLFFSAPALVYVQNYLQAIVITAALRLLARPTSVNGAANSLVPDFVKRVWTLLRAEIDSDSDVADIKIINLADEVVRSRRDAAAFPKGLDPEEDKRIRDTVERTLRTTDPVFLLLRKRLVDALEKRLISEVSGPDVTHTSSGSYIPVKMRTGKDMSAERSGKRPKLMLPDSSSSSPSRPSARFQVLGFEDDVLQHAISEVFQKLVDCISWTDGIWGDLV